MSRLKLERVKKNLTQKELSIKSGVGTSTISNIENGKINNIPLITLKKLASALNSTVEELFLNEE